MQDLWNNYGKNLQYSSDHNRLNHTLGQGVEIRFFFLVKRKEMFGFDKKSQEILFIFNQGWSFFHSAESQVTFVSQLHICETSQNIFYHRLLNLKIGSH